jgi:glucosyl-3-phosphoglycerate synthase
MFTFAVIGRDESERLGTALGQASEAAQPGDEVWFVDSGSNDGSSELAASLGAHVLSAPTGKGRAVARALDEATTEHLVLVDADIERTSANIPLSLREAAERSGADLIVAEFEEPRLRLRHSSRYVWRPLVRALFPEADGRFGRTPLSGFRALRTGMELGSIPTQFGAETHLNLVVAAAGGSVDVVDVGTYWGPVRPKPLLGLEVGAAILDLAHARGRLEAELRPRWDEWVRSVVEIVVAGPGRSTDGSTPRDTSADAEYVQRLEVASGRPLPPANR